MIHWVKASDWAAGAEEAVRVPQEWSCGGVAPEGMGFWVWECGINATTPRSSPQFGKEDAKIMVNGCKWLGVTLLGHFAGSLCWIPWSFSLARCTTPPFCLCRELPAYRTVSSLRATKSDQVEFCEDHWLLHVGYVGLSENGTPWFTETCSIGKTVETDNNRWG